MDTAKTWLITGCDTGMGYSTAEVALEAGERVIVTARDLRNVAELCARFPETAHGYTLDVTNPVAIRDVVESGEAAAGGIDVLFNNAGYGVLGAAEETSSAEYRPMFEVNFFGLAEVTKAVLPGMRLRRRGVVFCNSSAGGYTASPGFAFYAASKFAVEGFAHALAQEVAGLGIKVVIVEPGATRTKFAGHAMQRTTLRIEDYEQTAVSTTVSRMTSRHGKQAGDPRKVGRALLRLSREDAPPLRIALGDDAFDRGVKTAEGQLAEFRRWEALSRSVAFDKEAS